MTKRNIFISILAGITGATINIVIGKGVESLTWWFWMAISVIIFITLEKLYDNRYKQKQKPKSKKRKHFLTSDEVFEIWYQLAEKDITQKEACKIYDISQSTVNNIANKKHKHQQVKYKIEPKVEETQTIIEKITEDVAEITKHHISISELPNKTDKLRKKKVHLSKGEVHEVENSILKEVEKDLIMSVMDISKNTFSAIKNGKHSKSSQN